MFCDPLKMCCLVLSVDTWELHGHVLIAAAAALMSHPIRILLLLFRTSSLASIFRRIYVNQTRGGSSSKILGGGEHCPISPFTTESIFSVLQNRKNTSQIEWAVWDTDNSSAHLVLRWLISDRFAVISRVLRWTLLIDDHSLLWLVSWLIDTLACFHLWPSRPRMNLRLTSGNVRWWSIEIYFAKLSPKQRLGRYCGSEYYCWRCVTGEPGAERCADGSKRTLTDGWKHGLSWRIGVSEIADGRHLGLRVCPALQGSLALKPTGCHESGCCCQQPVIRYSCPHDGWRSSWQNAKRLGMFASLSDFLDLLLFAEFLFAASRSLARVVFCIRHENSR